MKQIARLDYLDLQIYDEQKTTLIIPQADEDGLPYSSTLMVSDALAYELFALLKMPCHSSNWNSRVLYQSESKEIFLSFRPFQKSLQFKGLFFLRPDAIEKLELVIQFLKERNIKFLVSRFDISFISQQSNIYQALDRCDFKRLTQYLLKKKKSIVYHKAYNSRFALVAYGKTTQMKKEKGNDYFKKFLTCYGLSELPEDLINLELRVLGTDACGEITEQIADKIDLTKLKALVIEQATKRIKLTKKIHDLLLKSSI
ncbi:MAG: hypothetical protein K1X29_04935 [Bdellovibrionales bacterium]|nr:hypothetical protein [Bdellovibrionales bacterium]